jgi:predicted AAA+ superfamily ATPase
MSSLINIPEQHNQLISSYRDYIKQGFSDTDALKMNQVIDSLVLQLVKENRKFQYKLIRKGTTHTMYKDAIQNLVDRNYIIQCNKINNEMLLKSRNKLIRWEAFYKEFLSDGHFKLYYPDTGLLYTKMVEEKGKSEIVNLLKPILENYIAQTLQTKGYPFGFWESDSTAKIDFVIIKDGNIVPMEVHSNENTRSKSISILKENCDFPYAIKVSPKNFEYRNQVKYVPYYAAFCI